MNSASSSEKFVLIVGGKRFSSYYTPFTKYGIACYDDEKFFTHPERFSLVVFAGGDDVCPAIYGQKPYIRSMLASDYNLARDMNESLIFDVAKMYDIPMAGICRGAQFIWGKSGGILAQDVNGHTGNHSATTSDGRVFDVTSSHHQMAYEPSKPDNFEVIAWSSHKRSRRYTGSLGANLESPEREVEAFKGPGIVAFQFHPEWRDKDHPEFIWALEKVDELLATRN